MLLLLPSSTWPRAYMGDTYLTYLEDDLNTQCILCIYVFQCISICSKPIPVHPSPIHTCTHLCVPRPPFTVYLLRQQCQCLRWIHDLIQVLLFIRGIRIWIFVTPMHHSTTTSGFHPASILQLVLQIDGLVAVDKLVCCHLRNLLALLILPWIDQLRSADSSLRRDGPPRTIRVGSVHLVSTYTCVTSLVYQI